jgi:hypothetical protein
MRDFSQEAIEARRRRHQKAMLVRWVAYCAMFTVTVIFFAMIVVAVGGVSFIVAGWL